MMKNRYNILDSSKALIFSLFSFLAVGLTLTLIIFFASTILNVPFSQVQNQSWVLYLNIFLSEGVYFLVYILVVKLKNNNKLSFFKENKINLSLTILLLISAVICFLGSVNITNLVNFCFKNLTKLTVDSSIINFNNFYIFLLSVFLLGVMPAVCEELVFREIIFNGLISRIKPIVSIIVSSLCFALFHFSIYKFFYQFVLGCLCATILYLLGNVAYCMIFHFVSNFCVLLFTYTNLTASIQFVSWGTKEVLISIVFFLIAILIVAIISYVMSIKKDKVHGDISKVIIESKKENDKKGILFFVTIICLLMLLWIFNVFVGV